MKILVAEDAAVMREMVKLLLLQWDYEVVAVENGTKAWEEFQRAHYSMVLTDWIMPEMDGLELIERIRDADTQGYVYIILLTAKSEKEDLVAAMDAGADDFLGKPFDAGEFRVRLREGQRIINLEQTLIEKNLKLKETQAALVQSEKLASLGQLAAGMAHEINNPIAYVANNLAVLKRDVDSVVEILETYRRGSDVLQRELPDLAREATNLEDTADLDWMKENFPRLFDASLDGLRRVRQIVENLRDFARLDEADVDELDLCSAIDSTLGVLVHDCKEKQIEIDKQCQPLPKLFCQPLKINQVLHHLLVNAIEASPVGGRVGIRARQEQGQIVIEIEDQGEGIDPKLRSHIFEPFFTTKPVGQGTGLGLAVSYGTVRDHNGTIELESESGKGSLFRVRLPFSLHSNETDEAS